MPYRARSGHCGSLQRIRGPWSVGAIGDVILNLMHDRNEPLARTEGGGLTFEDSADRLWLRAEISEFRGDVRDQVKRAHPSRLQCRDEVKAEDWPRPDKRIIRAATQWGVAVVDRPAYRRSHRRDRQAGERSMSSCTATLAAGGISALRPLVTPQPRGRGRTPRRATVPHCLAAVGRSARRHGRSELEQSRSGIGAKRARPLR